MITSPYNFLPLTEKVFYPKWGDDVQHDMPFRDGVSGEIEIEVIAKRPIYTRNHAEKPLAPSTGHETLLPFFENRGIDGKDRAAFEAWTSFAKNSDGVYELPATLIHGAVRNLIKIIGCGSFRDARNEDRYAVRDLNLLDYKNQFAKGGRNTQIEFQSLTGWLVKKDDEWAIYPCGHHRVEQNDLCGATAALPPANRLPMGEFKKAEQRAANLKKAERAANLKKAERAANSVREKYDLWAKTGLSRTLSYAPQKDATPQRDRHQLPLVYRWATNIGKGTASGEIVFTGQPSPTKHMEFIFDTSASAISAGKEIPLQADGHVKRFLFAHQESEGLAFWKADLNDGKPVPVFYLGNKKSVKDFGLAQMFRLPARRTLTDGIPSDHLDPNQHDLADLIFGTVHGKKGHALRGRASFCSFEAQDEPKAMELEWTVLGEPRPSFYPNYLEQETEPNGRGDELPITGKNKRTGKAIHDQPNSLLSSKIRLRGWKRYAAWPDWESSDYIPKHVTPPNHTLVEPENIKSATAFAPLPTGSRFKGKLRFHNLRKCELGALIWAIEWGGNTALRHSLGMGKGLGLGSATMTIINRGGWTAKTFGGDPVAADSAIAAFKEEMEKFQPDWFRSEPIAELEMLATPTALAHNLALLEYPRLRIGDRHGDEFRNAKTHGNVLPRYSQLVANAPKGRQTPPPRSQSHPSARVASGSRPASANRRSLADLRKGQELPGTVRRYGQNPKPMIAFIDFGFPGERQDGGLSIREVSGDFIEHLPTELPEGTRVRVRIIAVKTSLQGKLQVDCSMKDVDQSGL